MTANTPRLTDDLLRRALAELAAGPDGDMLLTDVLRSVDSQPQVARRPWDTRGWGRAALLVAAAALLIVAAFAATVVLTRPSPEPEPSPSAPPPPLGAVSMSGFVTDLSYSVPAGETVLLKPPAQNQYDIYGRYDGPRKLELFLISGLMHGCRGNDEGLLDTEPLSYMRALRDTEGVAVGQIRRTTVGGLPAVQAGIDPANGTCSRPVFHLPGLRTYEPSVDGPSRLIVLKTSWARSEKEACTECRRTSVVIGILISAGSEDDLVSWLPTAQAYVDTFRFSGTTADRPAWHEPVEVGP